MTDTETPLHWAHVAVMAIRAIAIFLMSRSPKGVPQYKYLIHPFELIGSGRAYSALGQGQTVYYARNLDGVISTPLLLLSLILTGKYTISVPGPSDG